MDDDTPVEQVQVRTVEVTLELQPLDQAALDAVAADVAQLTAIFSDALAQSPTAALRITIQLLLRLITEHEGLMQTLLLNGFPIPEANFDRPEASDVTEVDHAE